MSAAEKLAALVKGFWEDTEPSGYEAPVEVIRALPEIIAVVKAAAAAAIEDADSCIRVVAALFALDEKLGDVT